MSLTLTVFPVPMSSDLAINLRLFPGGASSTATEKKSSWQLCVEIRLGKKHKLHSHRIRPGKLQWESAEHSSEICSASLVWNTYRNTSKHTCWRVCFIFNIVRIKRWRVSAESSQLTCGHLRRETLMVSIQFLLVGKGCVHTWMSVSAFVGTYTVMPLRWITSGFWGI